MSPHTAIVRSSLESLVLPRPVPCKTTAEAYALRDSQCTDIQKQVLNCRRIQSCRVRMCIARQLLPSRLLRLRR